MALLIKADGREQLLVPRFLKRKFSLEEVQREVGGYVEQLHTRDQRYLLVNEEGQRLNLPFNARATELLHPAYGRQSVFGDVLVVNYSEWASS